MAQEPLAGLERVFGVAEGVGDDQAGHAAFPQQLEAALHERHEQVPLLPERLVALALLDRLPGGFVAVVLEVRPHIRRIADHHIERVHAEHPLRVEPIRRGVLAVGVPVRDHPRFVVAPAQFLKCASQSPSLLGVPLAKALLLSPCSRIEVQLAYAGELVHVFLDLILAHSHLIRCRHAEERVGGDQPRLQVRQRADAVVAASVVGRLLFHGERDEEPKPGDLAGHGLQVHAEDAVLDQVELAPEVRIPVGLEGLADVQERRVALPVVAGLERCGGAVTRELLLKTLPMDVLRVKPPKGQGELVQCAHREGAGTHRGIKHAQVGDGADDGLLLRRVLEQILGVVVGVLVVQQIAQALAEELRVAIGRGHSFRQGGHQRLVHHVVHDAARRVVGAGCFPHGLARFGVVSRQQVLEYAPEQLRIQRDLLIERRVLFHGEFEAAEEAEQAVFGVQQDAGGYLQRPALMRVASESVDASAIPLHSLEIVQAVEQAAIDERHSLQLFQEAVWIR